jgi:hypothetical protein
VFAAGCIVAVGFCAIAAIFYLTLYKTNVTERDFVEYWASEHQLVHGVNPYDVDAIFKIERAVGLKRNQPEISFSPPVALFLALPLGYVDASTGLVIWSLLLFVCLSLSLWILWRLQGRPPTLLHLFGFLFAPVLVCIQAGQIGIFLLFGVVLFLYLHKSWPLLAGAALLPCALKPHLFLPFAIALLLWVVTRRAYRILAGFSIALLASCLLTLHFDPHVWSEYAQMMRTAGALDHYVPTLSASLRYLVVPRAVWVQFLPEASACCWSVWFFWTRRRWNWMREGMVLLLVSEVCTPYAWFTDESVLLPAVFVGVARAIELRRSLVPIALIAGVALIEAHSVVQIKSTGYLWTSPAWLAWYLYATRSKGAETKELDVAASESGGTQ